MKGGEFLTEIDNLFLKAFYDCNTESAKILTVSALVCFSLYFPIQRQGQAILFAILLKCISSKKEMFP